MATAKKIIKKTVPLKKKVVAKPVAKTTKKTVAKKPVRRAAKPEAPTLKPIRAAMTQTDFINKLAEKNELQPKQIKAIFAMTQDVLLRSLMKGGVGTFKLLGFNFKSKIKPARKIAAIKKGTIYKNPFNGGAEEAHKGRPASVKPASIVIKAMALKAAKDAVAMS